MPAATPTLLFLAASAASLLLALLPADGPVEAPVVRTHYGRVQGAVDTSHGGRQFFSFHNIPYAKPPLGQLRFKSPQAPDSWTDIRDATVPGPACLQNKMMGPNEHEDCLYLNIFTPELKPTELLPVMFWIHGGAWISGTGRGYEAGFLMDHDVVLVTINYRLGPLGFLSTDDENCPGNFGLKDQTAALKWVKENIKAFGGNPEDITIFGNSAGAASVHYHMLSPASKGLFQRAVSESGVAVATWAVPEPGLNIAREVAAMVGCPTKSNAALVECLRGVDGYKLTLTIQKFIKWFQCPMTPFGPVLEEMSADAFLPESPLNLKPHTDVPWLMGVNSEEGAVFTGAFVTNETMLDELVQQSDKLFPLCLGYEKSPRAKIITEKIRNFYFPTGKPSLSGATSMFSDALITWKADVAIRTFKGTAPIYYYLFSYRGKYSMSEVYGHSTKNIGVAHGDEMFYLFSNNPNLPVTGELPPKDIEMAKRLTKLWTDFAKMGNPTPNNDPLRWPRVKTFDGDLEYVKISEKLESKKGLFKKRVDFWNSLPF